MTSCMLQCSCPGLCPNIWCCKPMQIGPTSLPHTSLVPGKYFTTSNPRGTTNDVTFPSRRCREAVRTASFSRIFEGIASFTGRVFSNFAAGRLSENRNKKRGNKKIMHAHTRGHTEHRHHAHTHVHARQRAARTHSEQTVTDTRNSQQNKKQN